MGAVYMAEHVVIEKKVALKVLFPDLTRRSDLVHRFLQEARSASRINHENVIDINDFGQSEEGYVFIAMELLTGTEFGQVLREGGPLSWERAQPILLQIGKALRAAHEKGIVHRDMKPENVFILQREGRPDFVKVLDFGIAKVLGMDQEGPRLTRTGMIFGTPEYMAPEQAQGAKIDPRVDVYSVGCIMYHVLTGDVPFRADSFMAVLSKHMLEEPVRPRVRNPSISEEVEQVILKALAKDPDERFQSMSELCTALAALGPMVDHSGRVSAQGGRGAVSGRVEVQSGAVRTSEFPREMPLAPPNPEMRRSQTETVSRGAPSVAPSFPPRKAAASAPLVSAPVKQGGPAGRAGWLFVVGAVVVLAGIAAVLLLRRGSPSETVAVPNIPVANPVAPPPAILPADLSAKGVVNPALPSAGPGRDTESGSPTTAEVTQAPGDHGGARKDEGGGSRKRRSSREAVEALRASGSLTPESAPHETPSQPPPIPPDPTVRAAVPVVPAEIKNPFAPGK
jgi:serine/threonine protein kinase